MEERKIEMILSKIDPTIKLDKEQKEIVLDSSCQLMIIAGAGSGKTTTIVAKVLYLIQEKKVDPKTILMISFTNETIRDLKKQLHDKMHYPVEIMTFHKLGLEIIKKKVSDLTILSNKKELVTIIISSLCKYDTIFQNKCYQFMNTKMCSVNSRKIKKEDSWETIKNSSNYIKFIGVLLSFWSKWDTLVDKGKEDVIEGKKRKIQREFFYLFQKIEQVYHLYKTKHHLFDFSDMIKEATKLLKEEIDLSFSYIFVDEYQDISYHRFLLLKTLVEKTQAKLVVVGDDWQSIYQFSGSDSNLFIKFPVLFPGSQVKFLTMTYRNSNELIQIAGRFIMKNKSQIQKSLQSTKHIDGPIIYCYYRKSTFTKKLNYILEMIAKENCKQSILILGRYQHDISRLYDNPLLKKVSKNHFCYKHYTKLSICYLTIHAAKGLGYDQVIIINLEDGTYGFPTKVQDNSLIAMLKSNNRETYLEERRLFYVALTRTKNRVYLCIPYLHKSKFIRELKLLK